MSNINGFKGWLFVIALIGCSASAQLAAQFKVVISNTEIPGSHISNISVSPVTGDIFITTSIPYTIAPTEIPTNGNPVDITLFKLIPKDIPMNGSTSVTWTTVNAASCSATGGVGVWADTVFTVNGNLPNGSRAISSIPTGVYTFTLTCYGSDGSTDTVSKPLTVSSSPALVMNSFSAVPQVILEGETTTVSWDVANMQSCTPSGGIASWVSTPINTPQGSVNMTLDTAGTYNFRLDCLGVDGDTDFRTTDVTVEQAALNCPEPDLAGSTISWNNLWGVDFPLPIYANANLNLSFSGYKAIEFNTADLFTWGSLKTVANTFANGARFGAISECPGVFDVPDVCKAHMGTGGIVWATDGSDNACVLSPDTTYYFNLTYTDGVDSTTSTCDSSSCITTVRAYNPAQ